MANFTEDGIREVVGSVELAKPRPIEAGVTTGVTLYKWAFYALDTTTGKAKVPTNGAGEVPGGFSTSQYVVGDTPVLEYGRRYWVDMTVSAADIGKLVYATGNNTFTTTAGSATCPVGRISHIRGTTKACIDGTLGW